MTAVEMIGIKTLIKDWCGLEINLIEGGPSAYDPLGDWVKYIGFRDKTGLAWGIKVGAEGNMATFDNWNNKTFSSPR